MTLGDTLGAERFGNNETTQFTFFIPFNGLDDL